MRVGVLALQGAFIEHMRVVEELGVETVPIRLPHQLERTDAIVIPGGESTTILSLMGTFGLTQPLRHLACVGLPMLGTCAGMICLAKRIADADTQTLAAIDIVVRRNAFGRQTDSFETEVTIPVLGATPFPGIFIRAPFIERAGPQVEILAELPGGEAVAAKQGRLIVTAFHPELSCDVRMHRYFLQIAGFPGAHSYGSKARQPHCEGD